MTELASPTADATRDTKARWAILRQALQAACRTGDVASSSATASNSTYAGLAVLPRSEAEWIPTEWIQEPEDQERVWSTICESLQLYRCQELLVRCVATGAVEQQTVWSSTCRSISKDQTSAVTLDECSSSTTNVLLRVSQLQPDDSCSGEWRLATYQLPGGGGQLCVRERAARRRTTLAEIFSHRVHGVDNTGNVRVWPSESLLLHHLVSTPGAIPAGARVLEIGGGMTALAGLGVAAAAGCRVRCVVVTDGHPDAVRGQRVCARLNRHAFGATRVAARRLVTTADNADSTAASAACSCGCGSGPFDVVIGSDCLFFEDFHADLIEILRRLIAPCGRAVLLQPSRGGSMERFAARARDHFDVYMEARYDDSIWERHQQLLLAAGEGGAEAGGGYREDTCFPVLMTLRHIALQ
ncbi:hypothetical protein JKP88DRAFT_207881 [Tribonema minus]|uniref:Calmodulin-lysine N-methyltransferase n=1 Tax=Tribonema minus TaxID=303371 RepID=A0A835Z8K9_9STRA|nr:hypothetical protein JKP88DRAFT_207881 [Tribonema minus]